MSDSLAIAAVTATIRHLLFTGVNADVAGTDVTTRPPDRMTTGNGAGNRLNLFLYQTSIDAAWRNEDYPGHVKPGEDGRPPLPLSLHYLVTSYAADDNEIVGHRLLGRAMSILHDHPLLGSGEIKDALNENDLGASDLDQQVERVRITPQPMTLEEMSKLWTTFQTQYRISAAYQACVVLIESRLPIRTPVPVLARSDEHDRGPVAQASTVPPLPTIEDVGLPDGVIAGPGAVVTLTGHDLGDMAKVLLSHPRLPVAAPVDVDQATDASLKITLPVVLPAGLYTVRAVASDAGALGTNVVSLVLPPQITNVQATRDPAGLVTIGLDVKPAIISGQEAFLLVGQRSVPIAPVAATTSHLDVAVPALAKAEYYVRLRVDGVDSSNVVSKKDDPNDPAEQPHLAFDEVDVP